jgi:pyridoxal 5'-phosphate synthase pdxT subunit
VRVGVFAYQGDVREHIRAIEQCGASAQPVRYAKELRAVDALILPGGESTTIGKLIVRNELIEPLREFAASGKPIFGTCAGMILLAKEIVGNDQFRLGLMDITVARNAYGRQVESFEAELDSPAFGDNPLHGVFIRAPRIAALGADVEALARYNGEVVLCRQNNLLAASFHPELTADCRVHRYFLAM